MVLTVASLSIILTTNATAFDTLNCGEDYSHSSVSFEFKLKWIFRFRKRVVIQLHLSAAVRNASKISHRPEIGSSSQANDKVPAQ